MKAIFVILFGGLVGQEYAITNGVNIHGQHKITSKVNSRGQHRNLKDNEVESIQNNAELQAQLDQVKGAELATTDDQESTQASWGLLATCQKHAEEYADQQKKQNDKVKQSLEVLNNPAGVGIDVANWIGDDKYFKSVIKQYVFAQTRTDGSETGEKLLNKDDAEKSVRQMLVEKLDNSAGDNKLSQNVGRLMGKFFQENWEYADAANEGSIEASRAPAFFHRIINEIKMDDEEESLLWKQ